MSSSKQHLDAASFVWHVCSCLCSWWPTPCSLPVSTCQGCLWGFSLNAPRGKFSCRPATASRSDWGWRMKTRSRWGGTHGRTGVQKTAATRFSSSCSAYVHKNLCSLWRVFCCCFFSFLFFHEGFRCQCILTACPRARSNYDSSYLRKEQLLWHMHQRHHPPPLHTPTWI